MRTATVRRSKNGRQPVREWGSDGEQSTGATAQVEQEARVVDGIGAQGHRRLVTEQLALAVEAVEEPMDQRVEEKGGAEKLLGELGPVVVPGQVRRVHGAGQARRCGSGQSTQSVGTSTTGRRPTTTTGDATAGCTASPTGRDSPSAARHSLRRRSEFQPTSTAPHFSLASVSQPTASRKSIASTTTIHTAAAHRAASRPAPSGAVVGRTGSRPASVRTGFIRGTAPEVTNAVGPTRPQAARRRAPRWHDGP